MTGHPLSVTWGGHLFVYGPWLVLGPAAAMIFVIGRPILAMALSSARRKILNQHVLLEAGAFGGLIGGLLGLFVAPEVFPAGAFLAVAVFITTYHLLSGYVSSLVRSTSSAAVRRLLDLQPDTARVLRDGSEVEVPVGEVALGEQIRVRPGERVPLDAEVTAGVSAVDESMVTGEPIPVRKAPGDEVIGGSVNTTGALTVEVIKVGEDTFLAQVARHIEEARALQPGIIVAVDRVLKVFVPVVLGAAVLSLAVWTLGAWAVTGHVELARGIFAALAALVMGYPCALGMSTPLAMMRGGALAAERGILIRSGEAFQVFSGIDTALIDKTGTLTAGRPSVVEIVPAGATSEGELLAAAAAVEIASEHPLARAVVAAAEARGLEIPDADGFSSQTGRGVTATVGGVTVAVGKADFVASHGADPAALTDRIEAMQSAARTVVAVASGGTLAGLIGIADEIRPDAADAVGRLRAAGITPVMVTGDNAATAEAVAAEVGIGEVHAGMLPDQKAGVVRDLQASGHKVVMVGDGINDAPALTQADIGVAMGAGTDIAIESADVVLVGNRLAALADARDIGASSFRKTKQNLTIALGSNGIGVPLAVTGLVAPTWAMIAMISSVSVVLANSFASRRSVALVAGVARFLARSALSALGELAPARLRHWAWNARSGAILAVVAVAFGTGAVFVVALGAPVAGGL